MKSLAFGLAVLALAGSAAATPLGLAPDYVPAAYIPAPPPPAGLTTITDNIAHKYPKGLYNRVAGRVVTGPNNQIGYPEYWIGAAFTPASDVSVKRVQVAVSSANGTNAGVVALYDDNAGVPGNVLKAWHMTGLPPYGSCCTLTVKNAAGVPLTGGHQYWVVVKTDGASQDSYVSWNYNTSDQTTLRPVAYYCKDANGVTCTNPSGTWLADTLAPVMTFAVLGN